MGEDRLIYRSGAGHRCRQFRFPEFAENIKPIAAEVPFHLRPYSDNLTNLTPRFFNSGMASITPSAVSLSG
jgi:hypothetical protein